MNTARLSKPMSEETKMKISKSSLGRVCSDSTKLRMSEAHKQRVSYPRKSSSVEKHVQTFLDKHPLDLPNINLSVWVDADFYFVKFNEGFSRFRASNLKGISKGSLVAMWKRFEMGWNPLLDSRWVLFKTAGDGTSTDPMNIDSNDSNLENKA